MLLAKTIATLDVISGGRTQLPLGVGWQAEEYVALGIPHEKDANGRIDVRRSLAAIPEYAAAGTRLTIASPPEPESRKELFDFIREVGEIAREYD